MIKKLSIFLFVLAFSTTLFAQNQAIIRADGKIFKPMQAPGVSSSEIQPIYQKNNPNSVVVKHNSFNTIDGTLDTLSHGVPPGTVNFGFFGQDRMAQWFEAPADMTIKGAAFNTLAVDVEGTSASLKLVKLVWTKDQILSAGVQRWGYYPAAGNGYNDATAFMDDADADGGDWVDIQGDGLGSPFGADLWSDGGDGFPVTPVADGAYAWVDMNILTEPDVLKGDIVAVVMKHEGATMDADRIGFNADNSLGIPGFKFYANGRLDTGVDYGWWSRKYTWDFVLAVELTGDIAPKIEDVTDLPTTLSTDPRMVSATITDINPADPNNAGVASASLWYTTDSTFIEIAMTANGDVYSADIPGQAPGTHVEYYVTADDVAGNPSESRHFGYNIFAPSSSNLLVFNGYTKPTGYPQSYYFGHDDFTGYSVVDWPHDVWSYGPLTAALVDNYSNIFEIATKGPNDINNDYISTWLGADGARNYLLAGDEWLGAQSNWTNMAHAAGEFHFDVLGINFEYNDVNYAASGDQQKPSLVTPIAGTTLGDSLATLFAATGDSMYYHPAYEIGVSNWLDGADFESDVEVFLTGTGADGNTYNIGGSRTLGAGNKIAFLAYDPLSLDAPAAQYYWYGFSSTAPQVQALAWFDALTSVREIKGAAVKSFELTQNYPNPFNPSTVIRFSIPQRSDISLKVFDVLGREVATLINEVKDAGSYEANFDASQLATGIYVYQLKAGSFVSSKKMMLIK